MEDAGPVSQMREILDVISHSHAPVMILQASSFVITAASPGAHELLDPLAQPLVGRSVMDFLEGNPSGAMSLLAAGRITGYETVHVLKLTGQRRRLWINTLPDTELARTVIAVMLKEDVTGRTFVPWKDDDALSPVIGSTDARLMVDRISGEVFGALGYRPEEIIGTSLLGLIVPEDIPAVLLALARTSRQKEGVALRVGVVGADLVCVQCQLVLLPLTPTPSSAFALVTEVSEGRTGGPADGRAVADLITRLGGRIRGAMAPQAVASAPLRPSVDLGHLSSRELEIVTLLMGGDRVSSIAKLLFLSEGTIRNHLSSVFGKLGVGSQQELIELLRSLPAHDRRRK